MKAADPVTAYAKKVAAGKVVTGRYVRLAAERHLRDLKQASKLGLSWVLSRKAGKRDYGALPAIEFYPEHLALESDDPFELLDFQTFIIGSCFGWYRDDGFRRYRDAYVETGKGSGKSPLAAGIGIYGLIADGEPAAEVYSAATTQDQAKIVWKDADRMVTQNPELRDLVKQEAGCLTFAPAGKPECVFRPVSSEHKGLDGKRVHIGLIDELHEHPSNLVVQKIKAGTKRRQNALVFRITNSGFDRTSVCWNEHDYSIKVLQGVVKNEAWFAYVCALDPCAACVKAGKQSPDPECPDCDNWTDEKVWPKANPGMAYGLPPITYLREQVTTAVGMPSSENLTRRLNFCEWTEQDERWLDVATWNACGAPIDVAALAGRRCFAALDAGATGDLCALAILFEPDENGVVDVLMRFWIPQQTLTAKDSTRTEADKLLLRQWVDAGFITATPGRVTNYDLMEQQILDELAKRELAKLGYDPWNVTQLVTHLQDKLGEDRVIGYSQGFQAMSPPTKDLEKRLLAKTIRHGGNPVLAWMAANVALRDGPEGQVKPDRERSREKIDGIVAVVMGLGMLTREPAELEAWDGHVSVIG